MNKRHLITIAVVLVLLAQLLAACDSGSPSPTPVASAPTQTIASRSQAPATSTPSGILPTPNGAICWALKPLMTRQTQPTRYLMRS